MQSAQGEALEFAVQGAGDALAQRGFAYTGGSHQQDDRGFGARVQLHDGQMLEDAFLHGLESEMIFLKNAAGTLQVVIVVGGLVPG